MSALRLECFTNNAPVSSKNISLFDGFESEKDIAFSRGVKTGAQAATKAFEAEKIRSLAPILEAINDIGFSQIEARQAAINSLHPLISAIMNTALPASAATGFTTEVVTRVMELVQKLPQAKINIHVPDGSVSSITKMLALAKAEFLVLADPALGPLEARVEWGTGFEHIDIAAVIQTMDQATQEFFKPDENQKTGGQYA